MKRCPECRRDYTDETLNFCLDDGAALLDGPASADEPATAILSAASVSGGGQLSESATHAQLHTTDQTAVFPSSEEALRAPASRRFTRPLIVGISAVLIAGASLAYYKFADRGAVVSFDGATLARVTDSGQINFAEISPDGKWLAYNFYISGLQESIWLQQVGVAGSSTEIVKPAEIAVDGITFSPDNKYIYYNARDKSDGYVTGTLYQIPVLGGTAKKVLSNISDVVSFSPDGKRLAYFFNAPGENVSAGAETRLMIANADGTEQRVLASRNGNEFLRAQPGWSPDGKRMVVVHGTVEPPASSLVSVSPETGEITPFLTGRFRNISQPTWLSDGNSLLVLATEKSTDRARIWQISYPSGEARKIEGGSNDPGISFNGLSLTSDSSVLATTQATDRYSIWTASTSDPTAAAELKLGTDMVQRPAWLPGGRIVYSKRSSDAQELYTTDPQGGIAKQFTSTSGNDQEPVVSPDGRYVVYTSYQTGNPHLWRINIDGSDPKQLTTTDRNYNPSISSDGRQVYYTCNVNKWETLCKIGMDGGERVQLTTNSASNPQISADGKRILCFYRDAPKAPAKIAIIPADGGTPLQTFPLPDGIGFARWMAGDQSFFYSTSKDYVTNLWIQPVDGGPAKQYTNFTSLYLPWADFSQDGKKVVYSRLNSVADVILISGFKK